MLVGQVLARPFFSGEMACYSEHIKNSGGAFCVCVGGGVEGNRDDYHEGGLLR